MVDLLVAGAGPAGLAAAIYGARLGMRVMIVDPLPDPIDKACGEGIMPSGRARLEEMGVDLSSGTPFHGVRYWSRGKSAVGHFASMPGIAMPRTGLSSAMWQRAHDLGVERRIGRIRDVSMSNGHVTAGDLEAGWLIVADGIHSAIRKGVGIGVRDPGNGRFGIRQHFRHRRPDDYVNVYLGRKREAYVTPVGSDVVGVAILSPKAERFDDGMACFSDLAAELGDPIGNVRGAGPFNRFAERVSLDRLALVGDAAGFLDPITGEGVRLALESAALAVRCIDEGSLDSYDAEWRRAMRRYRQVTSTLLRLRRTPVVRSAIVPFLRIAPTVFDLALRELGGYEEDRRHIRRQPASLLDPELPDSVL